MRFMRVLQLEIGDGGLAELGNDRKGVATMSTLNMEAIGANMEATGRIARIAEATFIFGV
jgi:hypothetical protein